ncbi:MAG: hypothetical protein LJE65_13650 [Desulfobacteraceae bacterium]|nr:hypothetical protein [Desulfobacteraceae bacterium]
MMSQDQMDCGGRRFGPDRRQQSDSGCDPERRSGRERRILADRRSGFDRRSPKGFRRLIGLDRRRWFTPREA